MRQTERERDGEANETWVSNRKRQTEKERERERERGIDPADERLTWNVYLLL